jgi:hypothetical protein
MSFVQVSVSPLWLCCPMFHRGAESPWQSTSVTGQSRRSCINRWLGLGQRLKFKYAISDQSIVPHVKAEFEKYNRRGMLEYGFLSLYCRDCQAERLIGFSYKGRGFCPACGSRRALQKADRIEREVWPRVKAPSPSPVRQTRICADVPQLDPPLAFGEPRVI